MKIMMPIVGLLLAVGCKPETAPITPAPEAAPAQTTEAGTPTSPTGAPSPQTSLPGIHGAPAASGHVSAQTDTKTLSGTVQEVIPARNYLYLKLESEGDTLWAAVLKADVSVGASVEVVGAALMRNFTGTSINRTFPEIWFGTLGGASTVAAPTAAQAPPSTPDTAPPSAAQEPLTEGTPTPIAEVIARAQDLSGQPVTVRGKVVKYNANIMGKNWVHLQDGSGTAENGNHDILITTNATTAVGQQVIVTGRVALEQDFGHGYHYAILLEDGDLRND